MNSTLSRSSMIQRLKRSKEIDIRDNHLRFLHRTATSVFDGIMFYPGRPYLHVLYIVTPLTLTIYTYMYYSIGIMYAQAWPNDVTWLCGLCGGGRVGGPGISSLAARHCIIGGRRLSWDWPRVHCTWWVKVKQQVSTFFFLLLFLFLLVIRFSLRESYGRSKTLLLLFPV